MDQKLLSELEVLKREINDSEEVKKLQVLNDELNKNEEVMKLAYQKDVKSTKYDDAIRHFGENSKEAEQAQKELYQAKLALDSHELVKRYNEQFKIVRKMYDKINEELFHPFN